MKLHVLPSDLLSSTTDHQDTNMYQSRESIVRRTGNPTALTGSTGTWICRTPWSTSSSYELVMATTSPSSSNAQWHKSATLVSLIFRLAIFQRCNRPLICTKMMNWATDFGILRSRQRRSPLVVSRVANGKCPLLHCA